MVNNFLFPPSRGGVELHHERANERVICHRNAWLFGHGRWRGQTQPPKSYEPPNHQHRLFRRTTDSGKIFLRRQRRFAAAQVDPARRDARNTKSFALIADDPDAPVGTWVHWVLYDLPPNTTELPEDVAKTQFTSSGAKQGLNSWPRLGYGGPCPPPGKPHRYFFKLYALDTMLDLKPGATKKDVEAAMKGLILAEGQLMGTYQRK